MQELKKDEIYTCQVCGARLQVLEDSIPTQPLSCCGIEMEKE